MNFHKTVLLKESIKALKIKKNGIYIDCTFGFGGHSKEILKKLNKKGYLYAFEKDPENFINAKKIKDTRFKIFKKNFSKIKKYSKKKKIKGLINGILIDLGISNNQLKNKKRGFSFKKNSPLDMRINQNKKISLSKWLQKAKEKKIFTILKKYGNEKFSKKISKAIFKKKKIKKILTTKQLKKIIKKTIPIKYQYKKSLQKTFLAFRIYLNKEKKTLKKTLKKIYSILAPNGRLVIITFNSLEDKIVKNFIKKNSKINCNNIPIEIPIKYKNIIKINKKKIKFKIIKKIKPKTKEKYYNSNSKSAILRVIEKI
ncbi:16S rRNA (cytosine(1402)-N(4))-methyltransferase RsmH [Buchnera aphidicola]|uniref:16S rRNA (cytosine(1402)-N(4))-methyltransferase RsmH n=1 Tax=Buchnera aphidicola TaxID=9 RepID=UPI0031B8548A